MPPRRTVFKTQGSQDKEDVDVTGWEMFTMLGYFQDKCSLTLATIGSVLAGAAPLLMLVLMGDLATGAASGTTSIVDAITPTVKQMIYINVAMVFIMGFSMVLRSKCTPIFTLDIRNALYKALMNQPIEYFDQASTGVLVSRLSEDVTLIRETYIDKALQVLQAGAQSIGGIIIAFTTSWKVSLVCLIGVPLVLLTFYIGEKYVDKLWVTYNEKSTTAASKAEEVITQFRTVKAFDGEMREYDIYSSSLNGVDDVFYDTSIAHGVKDGVIALISNLMTAAILYYTSYLIIEDPQSGVQAGDTMTIMMSLLFVTMGFTQVFGSVDDFRKANVSAAKILAIMNLPIALDRKVGNTMDHINGKIEFQNVGFRYVTRSDWAVHELDFTINPGETVALVGESGCGKTTTLSLLQRFYELTEGQILIDGVDIKTLSPVYLRSQIAIVPQNPVLFSMSIAENIRYGRSSASEEEIANAAQIGNAHDFIMTLKDNYKTDVQQSSLSGGQKQRVCISRAILANAPILLLDEATAALDTESEQLVQQSLEQYRHGKTAIVVAHRLATVKNADRILVFSQGKVVESGKHEELLASGGIYADLVKFQLQ